MSNVTYVHSLPDGFQLRDGFSTNEHDEEFLKALFHVCKYGTRREVRNGYTLACFDHTMHFDLQKSFPLLSTKEVKFNLIVGELLWFLEGGRDTSYRLSTKRLNEIDGKKEDAWCIWTPDQKNFADKGLAKFDGDCGVIYGSQWVNWNGDEVNQITNLIGLLKRDPTSRYMKVTAWNPGKIQDMCLPPCHENFQCFVREENGSKYLDPAMQQRSCDMFLGVPFNIASYALLTHMLAKVCGLKPGKLSIRLLDYHVYLPIEKQDYLGHMAQCIEQMSRIPYAPSVKLILPEVNHIDDFLEAYMEDRSCIRVDDYKHHPHIKAEMSPTLIKD